MAKKSTYEVLGLPEKLTVSISIFAIALAIAPWVSGQDIGGIQIPHLSPAISTYFTWGGPILFLILITGYFPLHRHRELITNDTKTSANIIVTHGDNSPGVVHGDFQVTQNITREYHEKQTKKWRPIHLHAYPIISKSDKYILRYFRHLYEALTSFEAYDSFTMLAFTKPAENAEPCRVIFTIAGNGKVIQEIDKLRSRELKWLEEYHLAGRPARMMKKQFRKIENESDPLDGWTINSDIKTTDLSDFPIAITCTVDPVRKSISSLSGLKRWSTKKEYFAALTPRNYEQHLGTTSEMLRFVAAARAERHFKFLGEAGWFWEQYSIGKLLIALLDNDFSYGNLRVNATDEEEWDYVNLKFDEEVRGYT